MKSINILLVTISLFILIEVKGQVGFNYQASIQSLSGESLENLSIKVRLNVLSGSPLGASVYAELQEVTTNADGIFSLVVGTGTVVSGEFNSIAWGSDKYFLKVEIDTRSSGTFIDFGTTQIQAVPISFYSMATQEKQDLSDVLTKGSNANGKVISNLADPEDVNDAATKSYVDSQAASAWKIAGNSISDPSKEFIGTTNEQPLRFRANNNELLTLATNGNVGIGITDPGFKTHVVGGTSALGVTIPSLTTPKYAGSYFEMKGGSTVSESHFGVLGHIKGSNGGNAGIVGISDGASTGNNQGLRGFASNGAVNTAVTGNAVGANTQDNMYSFYGSATGPGYQSTGVYATASGTSTFKYGAQFYSYGNGTTDGGTRNWGIVSGAYDNTTGNTGIYAEAHGNSTSYNSGVHANSKNSSTYNYGGILSARSDTKGQAVNMGISAHAEDGKVNYGGIFTAYNGSLTNSNYAVYSAATGAGPKNFGAYFSAEGGTENYALYAVSLGSGSWAGHFDGSVRVTQSVSIGAVLRLVPLAEAPSAPLIGDIYYDGSSNTIKYWNGTAWKTVLTN
jgi:trimeric autotransporter adhesin